ncbi:regulator of G-protein signaling 16-like [Sinocyclocheilus anshuiensis]|uniref:Regulator of G-protein signaling 16-like n=1 Tax=Sinocyclocheilus anshuiensis TaxID=1608454 RepID=A0A671LTS9_9TELE|nr:PREDICTED: regulator of G-protein signaling 16-like [Sinocyclocheilus anshuiensis]
MCRSLEHLPNTCLERAKELKARFGSFLLKQELNIMGHSQKNEKLMLEDRQNWSFHELLSHKEGQCAFTTFLSSEYSEENVAFYLVCEDYRNTKSSSKLCSKARKIYEEFICSDAPREVNLDHETRTITLKNMEQPTLSCFNLAQSKIYTLMEKDCYPRFLKSAVYQELIT